MEPSGYYILVELGKSDQERPFCQQIYRELASGVWLNDEVKNMTQSEIRKYAILITVAILTFFTVLLISNYFLGELSIYTLGGGILGFLLGVITCVHLSNVWDPAHLQMKEGHDSSLKPLGWAVPLGVVVANLVTRFLGDEISDLIGGLTLSWLYINLSYIAIQVWRYRPHKSQQTLEEYMASEKLEKTVEELLFSQQFDDQDLEN